MKKLITLAIATLLCGFTFSQVVQRNANEAILRDIKTLGDRVPQVSTLPLKPNLMQYTGDSASGALVYCTCTADTSKRGLYFWQLDKWVRVLKDYEALSADNFIRNQFATQEDKQFHIVQGRVDGLDFNTMPSIIDATQRLTWDESRKTLNLGLGGGNVYNSLGQELVALVYNAEASPLVDGEVVYLFGSQGNRISVKRASSTLPDAANASFGVVTEPIAAGSEGFVTVIGAVNKLNTDSLSSGAELWLDSIPGRYTDVKPSFPLTTVSIGRVERPHATVGAIYVTIRRELPYVVSFSQNAGNDSAILVLSDGRRLAILNNSTSPAGVTGNIQYRGSDGKFAATSTLTYDAANARVGIGTASPNAPLHVVGNSTLAGTSTITTVQTNTISAGGGNLSITGNNQTYNLQGASAGAFNITVGNTYGGTANHNWFNLSGSGFAPTSGSGTYSAMYLNPTVNQTGTASGQTRGIYILANITAATNAFRALEIANIRANDYGIFQSGAGSRNYFQGSVGIGTSTPNASAALDISSSDKGILIPRLTSVQASTLPLSNGLMYYNTDSLRLMVLRSSQWRGVRFTDESGGASLPAANELDILRYRGGSWVAEPDSVNTSGIVNVTGNFLMRYSGNYKNVSRTDSDLVYRGLVDSLLIEKAGKEFEFSTSGATPTNASVETLADNTVGQIELYASGVNASGKTCTFRRQATYKKYLGLLTLYSTESVVTPITDAEMATTDATFMLHASNNIAIQLTGMTSMDISWKIVFKKTAVVSIPL